MYIFFSVVLRNFRLTWKSFLLRRTDSMALILLFVYMRNFIRCILFLSHCALWTFARTIRCIQIRKEKKFPCYQISFILIAIFITTKYSNYIIAHLKHFILFFFLIHIRFPLRCWCFAFNLILFHLQRIQPSRGRPFMYWRQ